MIARMGRQVGPTCRNPALKLGCPEASLSDEGWRVRIAIEARTCCVHCEAEYMQALYLVGPTRLSLRNTGRGGTI
jgi:hypothetical protein